MAVFRRIVDDIVSTLEVTVAPDDPVEIRRVHLHNNNNQSRILRLTSYGEVILAPQSADSRHPAFNKLFIDSEFVPEQNLQIFISPSAFRPGNLNIYGSYACHRSFARNCTT